MALLVAVGFSAIWPAMAAAAPTNDSYNQSFSIPLNTSWSVVTDTAGATESGEPTACGLVEMEATVWFTITGNGGPIVLSTQSSANEPGSLDTVLAVYKTSGTPTTLNRVDCDDDSGTGVDSQLTLPSEAGVVYKVQVGGCIVSQINPVPCSSSLGSRGQIFFTALANDDRSRPEDVSEGQISRTNVTATLALPGEDASCKGQPYDKTVWFRFSAPRPGRLTLTASDDAFTLSLYNGAAGPRIDCDPGGIPGTVGSRLSLDVGQGAYYIQVGGLGLGAAAIDARLTLSVGFDPDWDLDNDGVSVPPVGRDCDDSNPSRSPDLPEIVNNGLDENCDEILEYDRDRDGAHAFVRTSGVGIAVRGSDCNDRNSAIQPGATDIPLNGVDDDCDGRAPRVPKVEGAARLRYSDSSSSSIRVQYLRVRDVTSGARVEVRCKSRRGRGCRRQVRTALVGEVRAARTVNFKALRGKRLRRGTVVEVRVTKRGYVGRYTRYKVKPGGYSESAKCLNPGTTAPRAKCLSVAL